MATQDQVPAFADERQEQIARLVGARGSARVRELAELFGVSEPTIRKDLTALQERGILKRARGGAMTPRTQIERELTDRAAANMEAKTMIADACLRHIHQGDAIYLDSGTTVLRIAEQLASRTRAQPGRKLTVLTNSLAAAHAVADIPGVEHVLLGGRLRRGGGCVVGPVTIDAIRRFHVNVAFIGVSGLAASGITVADIDEASVKATIIEHAQRTIVPVDHTKIGMIHFALVTELDDVDTVIIDHATVEARELCAEHSVQLEEAESAPAHDPR